MTTENYFNRNCLKISLLLLLVLVSPFLVFYLIIGLMLLPFYPKQILKWNLIIIQSKTFLSIRIELVVLSMFILK